MVALALAPCWAFGSFVNRLDARQPIGPDGVRKFFDGRVTANATSLQKRNVGFFGRFFFFLIGRFSREPARGSRLVGASAALVLTGWSVPAAPDSVSFDIGGGSFPRGLPGGTVFFGATRRIVKLG